MDDIIWTIEPEDIRWEMDWSSLKADGTRCHPDKPEKEMMFERGPALALLLLNDVVFLNSNWWEKTWPEDAKNTFAIAVSCNDTFAWGCADAEGVNYYELEDLYNHWEKDPVFGAGIWCIKKRHEMPQRPIADSIRKHGVWDLDKLKEEFGLRVNYYDAKSNIATTAKYKAYCEWCVEQNIIPETRESGWTQGWISYVKAHPKWHDSEWHTIAKNTKIDGWDI